MNHLLLETAASDSICLYSLSQLNDFFRWCQKFCLFIFTLIYIYLLKEKQHLAVSYRQSQHQTFSCSSNLSFNGKPNWGLIEFIIYTYYFTVSWGRVLIYSMYKHTYIYACVFVSMIVHFGEFTSLYFNGLITSFKK